MVAHMIDFTHNREDDDDKREAAEVRKQIRALQEVEDLKRLMGCTNTIFLKETWA